MAYIDLHMHTNYSDGTSTPAELMAIVRKSGVTAFSVTDHDTIDGFRAVRELVREDDPELVSGVELSVSLGDDDVHMLAYLFDPDHEEFNSALVDFQQKRHARGQAIVARLQEMGVDIPFGAVEDVAGESVIGRPHIAEALQRMGAVNSYQEAFDRFIKRQGPAYVPKAFFEPSEAMRLVHRAGGVTIVAHPIIDDMVRHIPILVEMGLDGIEVWHSKHSPTDVDKLSKLAQKYGLLQTGGSDFHGREGRHGQVGSQRVLPEYLTEMKQQANKLRSLQ